MSSVAVREEVREAVSPAESYNLFRSLEELGAVLVEAIAGGWQLDAFLVAAGMHQIVADELHPDPLRLDEIGKHLDSRAVQRLAMAVQVVRQAFRSRRLERVERELAGIVDELAGTPAPGILDRAAALVETIGRLPERVRSLVLRLPACFHDFDQRPEDLDRLARAFAGRFPDRRVPLLVIGVRTSGSYLGPLQAAALRDQGFEQVRVMTARPGRRLLRRERRLLGRAGLVLVVDDPPGTGGSLRRVIRGLGVPAERVVLLLQLFHGQELPERLAGYRAVCLPWAGWAVHAGREPFPAGRGHVPGETGLGYLGRAEGVIERRVPERNGDTSAAIAEHVRARAAALPVREDFSLRLQGEHAAWEVASNVLSRSFGRAGPAVKLLAVDAAARRLLRVQRPSLTECSTWHLGLSAFDPLHDLAGEAAGREAAFVAELLAAYGEVDPERFLLFELSHLWCRERLQPEKRAEARRGCSAAVRRYFARRLLGEAVPAAGPVCALDLDGVLETGHLGFPSTTRSGALALRALVRHGYRPVIASGRSAVDVAERCADYGLPGGVAEYGGALVLGGETSSLLAPEAAAAVDALRAELADVDPLYRHSVRAYGLAEAGIASALARHPGLRAIRGDDQTDFVPLGVDKAAGLRVLLAELGAEDLAFAVGDTAADLPMLELARGGAAPGHAPAVLRPYRVRRPFQAGLLQAVEGLVGARERPELDERTELLLTILSAQERGQAGMARAALRTWRSA